ncbi:hypothetical protein CLOSS21_00183, partial [Clostridium sp. SS2/1]
WIFFAFFRGQHFVACAERGGIVVGVLERAVAVVEQRREQRRRRRQRAAALGQRQRRVFVPDQFRQAGVGGQHAFAHADLAQPHPHRQGVDEQTHGAVGAGAAVHAAEQHRAEHGLVAAGGLGQHLAPGPVEDARGADAEGLGLLADALRQRRVEQALGLADVLAGVLHVLEAERRRGLLDIAEDAAEIIFVLGHAHAQARAGDEVAERHRLGQLALAAVLDQGQLLHQLLAGDVVHDQMVL